MKETAYQQAYDIVDRLWDEILDTEEFHQLDNNYRVFTHPRSGLVELEMKTNEGVECLQSMQLTSKQVLRLHHFLEKWEEFLLLDHFVSKDQAIDVLKSMLALTMASLSQS